MIEIKKGYDFYVEQEWIGTVETTGIITEHEDVAEFMTWLEEMFCEATESIENEELGLEE